MANVIGIMGESGAGKTTSFENLDPKTTFIINADKKPLPFPKKVREQYKVDKCNYFVTDDQNNTEPNDEAGGFVQDNGGGENGMPEAGGEGSVSEPCARDDIPVELE